MARSGGRTPVDGGRAAGGRSESTSLVATIVAWTRLTVIASLMATATLAGLLAVSRSVYEPRLEQSVEATAAARRAHEAMLDQETGLRGFLASGDERFLEPFERGRRDLPGHNDEVARLLAGEGRPGALLLDMRLAQQAWVDGWADEAVRVGRASGGSAPGGFLDEGRGLFDRYRQSYDALVTSLVARRRAAVQASSNSLLAVVSFAVVATGAFFLDSLRRGRLLRRAVGPPLAELLRRLDRIRAGDFGPQPPLHGPVELETIGSGTGSSWAAPPAVSDAPARPSIVR